MDSPNLDNLLKTGNEAFAQKNYHQALNHFLRALEIEPQNHAALQCAGKTCYKLKDYEKTITYITQALEQTPKDKDLLVMLGFVYIRLQDKMKAMAIYDRLKKVNPEKAEDLYREIYK